MANDNSLKTLLKTSDSNCALQRLNRPRVLFLAYAFPPLAVPGSVRAGYLAKYLARMGWEVTVVTPHPSLWFRTDSPEKIERMLPQEGIRRITTGLRWPWLDKGFVRSGHHGLAWVMSGIGQRITHRLNIENQVGWVPEIAKACRILHPGDVDVILATGNPFVAFRAARRLAQRLGVPFVLDYRDPWNHNPHVSSPRPPRVEAEERSLLRDCAAVTIVSASLALSLQQHFPGVKDVQVVTNGYDPEDLANLQPRDFGHFAIVYSGSFYPPKRVITPLMKALHKLASLQVATLPEWRFHYLGSDREHILAEAEKYGVRDRVVLQGRLSREESLSAVAGAGMSVVITTVQEEASLEGRGIVTGKVFESLGLGSRVLLIAPVGSDAEAMVEGTNCGKRFAGNQTGEIANYLREVMCGLHPKPVPPGQYAWTEIARTLSTLLRRVVDERRCKPHN